MTEEWRPTHHAQYEVSNLGRVRSWAKIGPNHKPLTTPRILRGSVSPFGYPTVGFWPDATRHSVHSLVAAAFIGPRPEGYQIMHRDDDPSNARADNLEYGTALQNVHQTISRGRQTRRKLTDNQVREIRVILANTPKVGQGQRLPEWTCLTVAKQYGVSARCIEAVWYRQNYKNVL